MDSLDLAKAQREESRWRILRVLDAGRPLDVSETLIWRTLSDVELCLTPREVRRELSFLENLGLVVIKGGKKHHWSAALTAKGVQYVEYSLDDDIPGIARPRQF